jgi:hypothetical protein
VIQPTRGHVPAWSVRISLAASTLAGLSVFGVSEDSSDMTLTSYNGELDWQEGQRSDEHHTIVSTVWTGIHRSPASS